MNETPEKDSKSESPQTGRNEPCPCGSGKKFKRCHGISAAPKLGTPKATPGNAAMGPGALTGGNNSLTGGNNSLTGGNGSMTGGNGSMTNPMSGGFPPGLDQMDPQMMMQVSQMLQRLPKGQIQKLQGLMQRAMSGKDVSRESAEFEKTLPMEFQQMLKGFQMPGMQAGEGIAEATPPSQETGMTPEEAKAIVAAAAAEGKISEEEAASLTKSETPSVFSRLFKKK